MSQFNCPHCQKPAFSWRDKYLAAKWKILSCTLCGERACSTPLLTPFYTLLYVWDVLLFGFLAYYEQSVGYLSVMIVGWLILDYFSIYLPLAALRRAPPPSST